MQTAIPRDEPSLDLEPVLPIVLRLQPVLELDDEQFRTFCGINPQLRVERTAEGDLEVIPPVGRRTGRRNAEITRQLGNWARQDGTGEALDSSAGFLIPNRAIRSPDAAWMPHALLESIGAPDDDGYLAACPYFAIELRSRTDRLGALQAKLREYLEHGARLGWLIDPISGLAFIYRPGHVVERLERPERMSADPELPGFVLDLSEIW